MPINCQCCCSESRAYSLQIGFRDVRLGQRQLLINGRAVMIKGVNRHEHDERRGKAITEVAPLPVHRGRLATYDISSSSLDSASPILRLTSSSCAGGCSIVLETTQHCSQESMMTDIRLIKQLNFNAVRASHYPNHSRW